MMNLLFFVLCYYSSTARFILTMISPLTKFQSKRAWQKLKKTRTHDHQTFSLHVEWEGGKPKEKIIQAR